jgi:hypothetical protein
VPNSAPFAGEPPVGRTVKFELGDCQVYDDAFVQQVRPSHTYCTHTHTPIHAAWRRPAVMERIRGPSCVVRRGPAVGERTLQTPAVPAGLAGLCCSGLARPHAAATRGSVERPLSRAQDAWELDRELAVKQGRTRAERNDDGLQFITLNAYVTLRVSGCACAVKERKIYARSRRTGLVFAWSFKAA